MKKVLFFTWVLVLGMATQLFAQEVEEIKETEIIEKPVLNEKSFKSFNLAFTAGYVFKYEDRFKDVYGHGMVNAITADGCFYPWERWGFGAKLSYWRAKGRTTFLHQRTTLEQIPVTFYAQIRQIFDCGLQAYGSLGGGFVWTKEKSYLGTERLYKGIGEIEVGLRCPLWRCLNVTGAFRYLFPPQKYACETANVGGCDLRAGIGFSF